MPCSAAAAASRAPSRDRAARSRCPRRPGPGRPVRRRRILQRIRCGPSAPPVTCPGRAETCLVAIADMSYSTRLGHNTRGALCVTRAALTRVLRAADPQQAATHVHAQSEEPAGGRLQITGSMVLHLKRCWPAAGSTVRVTARVGPARLELRGAGVPSGAVCADGNRAAGAVRGTGPTGTQATQAPGPPGPRRPRHRTHRDPGDPGTGPRQPARHRDLLSVCAERRGAAGLRSRFRRQSRHCRAGKAAVSRPGRPARAVLLVVRGAGG